MYTGITTKSEVTRRDETMGEENSDYIGSYRCCAGSCRGPFRPAAAVWPFAVRGAAGPNRGVASLCERLVPVPGARRENRRGQPGRCVGEIPDGQQGAARA